MPDDPTLPVTVTGDPAALQRRLDVMVSGDPAALRRKLDAMVYREEGRS